MATIRYTEYTDFDPDAVYDPANDRPANGVPNIDTRFEFSLTPNPATGGATFLLRDESNNADYTLGFLSRTQAAILADFSGQTAPVSLTGGTLGDVLIGGFRADTLGGDAGNDRLDGGRGDDTLNGGDGDDVLEGGEGADAIDGGAGVNTLSFAGATGAVTVLLFDGSRGGGDAAGDSYVDIQNIRGSRFDDRITGDTADNVIDGGAGADNLLGNGGDDTVSYARSAAGVAVDFRLFDDPRTQFATPSGGDAEGDRLLEFVNIIGSAFDDVLIGNSLDTPQGASANTLTGGAGNDVLEGMGGADTLGGGDGRDVASYQHATAAVGASLLDPTANTGDAAGDVYLGIEDLRGSAFADTLTGDAANNIIQPGGSPDGRLDNLDAVDGGAGRDTISYQDFGIAVIIDFRNSVVSEDGGTGTSATFSNIENALGTAFSDIIIGDAGDNVIEGGAQGDNLDGGAGIDTLSYRHSSAGVRVGLAGADLGRDGDAEADFFEGFENLIGSDFRDFLDGDDGDNRIEGGAGADEIDGGDGFDLAAYTNSAAGVTVDLRSARAQFGGGDAAGDRFVSIEGLVGSVFADTLTGTDTANVFRGGTGDTIAGLDGNDRIVLVGARGAAIDGGAGARDVLTVAGDVGAFASLTGVERASVRAGGALSLVGVDDGPAVIVSRGVVAAQVTITGGGADERIVAGEFDTLRGGAGDDTIVVADRQQLVDGGTGDDTLQVRANADLDLFDFNFAGIETVVLGDGAVVRMGDVTGGVRAILHSDAGGGSDFNGTAASDRIAGGLGDDRIAGGLGADVMRGGAGGDSFVFRALGEISTDGNGDRINGFVTGSDRIDLSEIDADGDAGNGDTAFTFVGTGAFTGTAGEIRVELFGGVAFVQIDTNGDTTVDASVLVRGDAPVAGDFIL